MNTKIKIIKHNLIEIEIEEEKGTVEFSAEFLTAGPFFSALNDKDFFDAVSINNEEGMIEWPNGYGLSILELYHDFKNIGKELVVYL